MDTKKTIEKLSHRLAVKEATQNLNQIKSMPSAAQSKPRFITSTEAIKRIDELESQLKTAKATIAQLKAAKPATAATPAVKSLREQINAIPDVKKRQAERLKNWEKL